MTAYELSGRATFTNMPEEADRWKWVVGGWDAIWILPHQMALSASTGGYAFTWKFYESQVSMLTEGK